MQDQWGRTVTLQQQARGFVYTCAAITGFELVLAMRDDSRALDQIGMVNAPARVPTAEELRIAAIDDAITGDTVIAQLKAMTNAQFDTWWAANVTTNAQAIAFMKRLARVVIRKVL